MAETTTRLDSLLRSGDAKVFAYLPYNVPHSAGVESNLLDDRAPYTYDTTFSSPAAQNYAAMISKLDAGLGALDGVLEARGAWNDTLAIFCADNGQDTKMNDLLGSNGNFAGIKRQLYEGGLRTPLIARWPRRLRSNVRARRAVAFPDLYATLLDAAGVADDETDGSSFLGTETTSAPLSSDLVGCDDGVSVLYFEYTGGYTRVFQQAARRGTWKALRFGSPALKLFDLCADPGETTDVALSRPDLVEYFAALMAREHVPDPRWPAPWEDLLAAHGHLPNLTFASCCNKSDAAHIHPRARGRPAYDAATHAFASIGVTVVATLGVVAGVALMAKAKSTLASPPAEAQPRSEPPAATAIV